MYNIFFSWQKESKFLFSQVRLPPEETATPPVFVEGMEVEVFSRSNDREACGWWCAEIKVRKSFLFSTIPLPCLSVFKRFCVQISIHTPQMIKGEFLVVEYSGWENSYTEIVAAERLRAKNTSPPITASTFHKFEIEVPEELRGL